MASKKCQEFGINASFKVKRSYYAVWFGEELVWESSSFAAGTETQSSPPAFASEPLKHASAAGVQEYTGSMLSSVGESAASITSGSVQPASLDIVEINGSSTAASSFSNHDTNFAKSISPLIWSQVERQNSEMSYYADDEDGNRKKYSRRGTLRHKFLRSLLPFWSSALPTLPVTAPPRRDVSHTDDASEGRVRHHRSSRMDPRKLLLVIAIMRALQQWVSCTTESHSAILVKNYPMKSLSDASTLRN